MTARCQGFPAGNTCGDATLSMLGLHRPWSNLFSGKLASPPAVLRTRLDGRISKNRGVRASEWEKAVAIKARNTEYRSIRDQSYPSPSPRGSDCHVPCAFLLCFCFHKCFSARLPLLLIPSSLIFQTVRPASIKLVADLQFSSTK